MMQDDIQPLQQEHAALREENAMLRALVAELLPSKEALAQVTARIKELEDCSQNSVALATHPLLLRGESRKIGWRKLHRLNLSPFDLDCDPNEREGTSEE